MAYLLLAVAQAVGLIMIPVGWPGIWLQLAALALFGWWAGFDSIGAVPFVLLIALAVISELLEGVLTGGRMDPKARRRLGLGGLAGGGAGAALALVYPLVGSMLGSLAGSVIGSAVAALWRREGRKNGRVGGHLIAMAIRTTAGVVVAVFTLLTIIR